MTEWMPIEKLAELHRKEAEMPKCPCPLCEAGLPHSITARTVEDRPQTVFFSAKASAKIQELFSQVKKD